MKLNFWQQYPLVKDDLQIVNQLIAKKIEVNDPKLKSALLQMANNGGKYLRPALLLLFSRKIRLRSLMNVSLNSQLRSKFYTLQL